MLAYFASTSELEEEEETEERARGGVLRSLHIQQMQNR